MLLRFSLVVVLFASFSAQAIGVPFQKGSQKSSASRVQKTNGKGPAYTTAPKGDLNFLLMGEFVGKIKPADGAKTLGLQIRVLGQDQFEANAYVGGLPGQPNFQAEPITMIGRRSGEFLILSGGPWAIFVEKNLCRVVDRKGKMIGQLKRVRRSSPTMHSPAPENATVLFDGTNPEQLAENFTKAAMSPEGLLMQGADLKPMFQDFNLHIEFKIPYMPLADGQNRGNSGLYLQSRYECQILDSFATTPLYNGCGALYRFKKPDVNMSFPPLSWQTYDVQFTAPRWAADGTKVRNATITSWVNGVKVQDNVSLPNKTGAGKVEEPILLPIRFQDHGDPVRFRNAWIVDRGLVSAAFPVAPTKKVKDAANKAFQKRTRDLRMQLAKEQRKKKSEADKQAAKMKKEEADKQAAKKKKEEADKPAAKMKNAEAEKPAAKKKKAESSGDPKTPPNK